VLNYHNVMNNEGRKSREHTMKKIFCLLAAGAVLLSGCALYVPDAPGGGPHGGPGNGFCPPGQAKKGNC
jgi:hypothetical protein